MVIGKENHKAGIKEPERPYWTSKSMYACSKEINNWFMLGRN
jgi:hypothetical protein